MTNLSLPRFLALLGAALGFIAPVNAAETLFRCSQNHTVSAKDIKEHVKKYQCTGWEAVKNLDADTKAGNDKSEKEVPEKKQERAPETPKENESEKKPANPTNF